MTTDKNNAAPDPQPAELSFDVEAMLTACVPGGRIVDPQVVADNIRAWVADHKPAELAEQQGDALIDTALGYLSTALDDLDSSPDRRPGIMVTEAMQALREAIATRQPGAQEPVGQVRTRVDGGFIAELFPGVADRVSNMAPLYVAPPAQGIDLSRVRASIQSLLNWVDDWAETPEESGINAIEAEAEAVLALIDQRDAGQWIDLEGAK